MAITKQPADTLKTRVNTCLNKLSDRDTLSMATNELETIARALSDDAFVPFLNCLSTTDSSEKSPVRRQCVRLLGILSATHGDALSPHVSRMVSAVLRRLRDQDSAVRAACVDAVSSITTHVTLPPFSTILKPLVHALFHEQDLNAQIGASLCLSAAVDAAQEVDAAELRKILPRVLKLLRSECFKAKPALFVFIGSIASAGCVKNKSLMNSLVLTAVEFLSSEDWAARKAAAEVLEKVAVAERDFVLEFKDSCISALESRRFDKVKVVRETMNHALEMWRDVPDVSEELTSPNDSSSSGHCPVLVSRSRGEIGFVTPHPRKVVSIRSPTSSCSSTGSSQKSIFRSDQDNKSCILKTSKLDLRKSFASRVVPFNCNDNSNMDNEDAIKENFGNQREFEDLSLIRKQLLQIENQQSSLFDLLQRFIGSSQKGMSSLEKRVDGLEKVLDEMSQDLAISTRRIPGGGDPSSGNTCCMIPRAEFLSPKFWRRTEVENVNSKFHSYLKSQTTYNNSISMRCNDKSADMLKLDKSKSSTVQKTDA